jgi:hypothetical protein
MDLVESMYGRWLKSVHLSSSGLRTGFFFFLNRGGVSKDPECCIHNIVGGYILHTGL